jgi:predicted nucleic acid-binding protein
MTSVGAVRELLEDLDQRAVRADPVARVTDLALKDPGDLRMLEAALAGDARYVVTTDREFLSHRGYGPVEFVTAAEFWQILQSPP